MCCLSFIDLLPLDPPPTLFYTDPYTYIGELHCPWLPVGFGQWEGLASNRRNGGERCWGTYLYDFFPERFPSAGWLVPSPEGHSSASQVAFARRHLLSRTLVQEITLSLCCFRNKDVNSLASPRF